MNSGLQNMNFRKRWYSKLDPFPHPVAWKAAFDNFMYALGLATPIVLIPQFMNVWLAKNSSGVSVPTWIGFGIINIFWLAYGIIHKEKALTTSNILFAVLNLSIALGAFIYR